VYKSRRRRRQLGYNWFKKATQFSRGSLAVTRPKDILFWTRRPAIIFLKRHYSQPAASKVATADSGLSTTPVDSQPKSMKRAHTGAILTILTPKPETQVGQALPGASELLNNHSSPQSILHSPRESEDKERHQINGMRVENVLPMLHSRICDGTNSFARSPKTCRSSQDVTRVTETVNLSKRCSSAQKKNLLYRRIPETIRADYSKFLVVCVGFSEGRTSF
jgi:hypothetical protein